MPIRMVRRADSRRKYDAAILVEPYYTEGEADPEPADPGEYEKIFRCSIDASHCSRPWLFDRVRKDFTANIASLEKDCSRIAVEVHLKEAHETANRMLLQVLQEVMIELLQENELKFYVILPDWAVLSFDGDTLNACREYLEKNRMLSNASGAFLAQVLGGLLGSTAVSALGLTDGTAAGKIERLSQIIPIGASEELRVFIETEQNESFYNVLKKEIEKRGMTEVECYKRANISRKLFWKIKNQPFYKPSKQTAAAFAVALRMELKDAEDLLAVAGYSFSGASLFDMIIKFHIVERKYDIYEINNILFDFDQSLLGG